jgi:methionyl-tRNA synthetase
MDQALELLPGDYWRWYLMANAPESSDAAFTWEQFQAGVNADLANVFGNFINRITRFCAAKFDATIPADAAPGALEAALLADVRARVAAITGLHAQMEFRKAAAETRALWVAGNEYLQKAAPWTAIKTDPAAAAVGVRIGLNLAVLFAIISTPFIPDAAGRVLDALGIGPQARAWPDADSPGLLDRLAPGAPMAAPDVLFAKIEDAQVAEWTARFGGG